MTILTDPTDLPEPDADIDTDTESPAPAQAELVPASAVPADHATELARIFADTGTLAQGIPGYRPRAAQHKMAEAVAGAIERSDSVIVEAGTGTGKTFAYLVPAMLWGGKVILSTGTKNLQDQLFLRDIPTVRRALNVPISVSLLKGRANYLCHYHLERAQANGRLASKQDAAWLHEIGRFAKVTSSGDKAELAVVPENAPVWQLVTSTRDNCLGSECPNYKDCFVMRARKEAQQADVVVVNHHLFFADVVLRDTGMAELLPAANTVIFDEAHQLPDTATLFFGETLSTSQLLEICRDTVAEGLSHARDAVDWVAIAAPLERAARDLRLAFGKENARLALGQIEADRRIGEPFFDTLDALEEALSTFVEHLESQAERAETLQQCHRRAVELQQRLGAWRDEGKAFERPRRKHQAPAAKRAGGRCAAAGCAGAVRAGNGALGGGFFAHGATAPHAAVDCADLYAPARGPSARVGLHVGHVVGEGQFHPLRGATRAEQGPFADAAESVRLRQAGPAVRTARHAAANRRSSPMRGAGGAAADRGAGGRTFLLCTTLRAVQRASDLLYEAFAERGLELPLLVQGQASRTELLDRFRELGNAVLVGSQSFWEGVDVRGEALSLVIIDKLPFAPPDDPVLAARMEVLQKKGLSPFAVHQLPHAVITLKQGAGRLIRSESDRGVLAICDTRLVEKPYGRQIWQSLPPFTRTREAQTVVSFLESLRDRAKDEPQPD